MASNPKKAAQSQDFLPINEIRDGVVILKNKSICTVLMASSLNFALKSSDEQISILMQFQSFLNSLDFSIQILVQSRKADIRPYLALLDERLREQTNELLRTQTFEYIRFIKTFTEQVDIMKKSFYVIVPYTPAIIDTGGGVTSILKRGGANTETQTLSAADFEEQRTQLEQRVATVQQGLARSGVRTVSLGTEELVELFYHTFNPADLMTSAPTGQ